MKNKKGLQAHMIMIMITSVVMSFLLFFIVGNIYGDDPQKCFNLDYEFSNICKINDELRITVDNSGTSNLKLVINGVSSDKFNTPATDSREIRLKVNPEQVVRVLPEVNEGIDTYQCNSKLKNIRVEDIRRC